MKDSNIFLEESRVEYRRWIGSGIKGRLFILLLAVLLPLLALQAGMYYFKFQEERADIFQSNLEVARAAAKMFDEFVHDVVRQEAAIGLAFSLHQPLSDLDSRKILDKSKAEYPFIRHISWVDPQGRTIASSYSRALGINVGDRPYFREIVAGRDWVVSDLIISRTLGRQVFTISRGIRDESGTLLGVMVAVVLPEGLEEILGIKLVGTGNIVLVDRQARIVHRVPKSEGSLVGMDVRPKFPSVEKILQGGEITAVTPCVLDDRPRLFGFTPVRSIGWFVGAGRLEEEVLAPVISSMMRHTGLYLLVAIGAFLAAFIISRTIAVPIRNLSEHAASLGRGEPKPEAMIKGPDEIQELLHVFNKMAEEIHFREECVDRERDYAQTLAEERSRYLARLDALIQSSTKMLAQSTKEGLLKQVVDAACMVSGAKVGVIAEAYKDGFFKVAATSGYDDVLPYPLGELFAMERGGVYRDLLFKEQSIHLTDRELRSHPAWWGLPDGHVPLRGLLGARLTGRDGQVNGLIMVSDKEEGDFTSEDKALLVQLAALSSLSLQHIEARGEAEQRAMEAEEGRRTLEALMEFTPEGITIAEGPEVHARMVSRYGLQLTGCRMEELNSTVLGEQAERLSLYCADGITRPAVEELPLTRAVWKGEVVTGEEWVLERSDGRKIPILCNAGPIRDKEGGITGGIVAWSDISALKEAREALYKANSELELRVQERTAELTRVNETLQVEILEREKAKSALSAERERFFSLLNNLPAFVFLMAPDFSIPFANRYFKEQFGNVAGRTCYEILLKRERPCTVCQGMEIFHTKSAHLREWTHSTSDRTYQVHGYPFTDIDGSPLVLELGIDITDRKRAEESLKMYAEKLEWSNRELQDFAFVASHDLQEPLRKIQAFGDRIKIKYGDSLNPQATDYLGRMNNAAKRMQTLIQALLDYSRVTTQAAPFTEIDLTKLIQEVMDDLEAALNETGGSVLFGELPAITGDRTQLYRLFQNLIANALKFHGKEKPVVKIHSPAKPEGKAKKRGSEDTGYRILVEDNGIGFDQKYVERIFAPFQRLHGSSAYTGVGMGLAICRKIVERHGGTITAESKPGKGSIFIITMPIKNLKASAADS